MTLLEASEKWNIKIESIKDLIAYGLIPLAEKNNGKWFIPNNTIKPIRSVHRAYVAFREIIASYEGAIIKDSISDDEFIYLSRIGFITPFEGLPYLYKIRITSLGREFVGMYEEKRKLKYKISAKLSFNTKLLNLEVKGELTND